MTNILFKKVDDNVIYFSIKGHTDIDKYGNDIVCSAISSTVIMTLNGIKEILKLDIKYVVKDGYIFGDLSKLNKDKLLKTDILTKSLLSILKDISSKYPNNVKFKIEEV